MSISRVIEVSFGGGSIAYAKVDTAYFYNNGIIFKPMDIDLPASYQVHWADSPQASSTLETIGTAEGAPIPDDLWNRSRVIYGWIYLHPTENSGVTGYEVRIYKNVRAGLPDGTEPTPTEQSTIDQLIGALNSAVEQTGEDVESAESAKSDAESARDNAQTYANNASASATSASTSASQASQSATASANSASASAQIKSDIEGMVDDAQSYAESALIASQASVTARDTAQGYAQSASASAQSASTSASNASTSAQTASTKATEASTSAQTASTKATEASQSASQALSYKTDAESAKTASQTAQGLAESARDTAVSAKTDAESARDDAVQAKEDAESAVASISGALDDKAPVITDTASGAIASFTDGADDLPLKSLVVDINPIQDLSHGDPSPENICPISGWTEIDVNHSDADMTNPTTISINLGQTVYGGKLDVLTGELVVEWPPVDLGTLNWALRKTGDVNKVFSSALPHQYTAKAYDVLGWLSDRYVEQLSSNAAVLIANVDTASVGVYSLRTNGLSDVIYAVTPKDQSPNGQLVYKLATPQTYQLAPHEVASLLGSNNVWADTGDTSLEYRADTKLFIERLTAPDSADMIADANITSGQYFMVGNSLYKATANIANGSAIIVGTNCIRKSLSEALNEINA